jgi:hypothetical protein
MVALVSTLWLAVAIVAGAVDNHFSNVILTEQASMPTLPRCNAPD